MDTEYLVTVEDVKEHIQKGGKAKCYVRLASGNDYKILISDMDDYKIVQDDLIYDYEMELLGNKNESI